MYYGRLLLLVNQLKKKSFFKSFLNDEKIRKISFHKGGLWPNLLCDSPVEQLEDFYWCPLGPYLLYLFFKNRNNLISGEKCSSSLRVCQKHPCLRSLNSAEWNPHFLLKLIFCLVAPLTIFDKY